jgi:hypothetical protein
MKTHYVSKNNSNTKLSINLTEQKAKGNCFYLKAGDN